MPTAINRFSQVVLVILAIVVPGISFSQTAALDKVVVVVNQEAITYSEYQEFFRRRRLEGAIPQGASEEDIDRRVIDDLVDEAIQLQLAEQNGVKVSSYEVDDLVERMIERNGITPEQFFRQLQSQGISRDDLHRNVEQQAKIRRIIDAAVNSRIEITESEVDYHLQSHKELYSPDESYELSHLFVSTANLEEADTAREMENMETIHAAINSGMTFENAVKSYSDSSASEEDGYLGWRKEDQLPDVFLEALRQTPIGGVTDVIVSKNGLHILKIHSKEGDLKIVTQQKIRHILIQPRRRDLTDEEAVELINTFRQKILSGEDFERYARLNSDDEQSAPDGGELGWVNPGETDPAFESASLALELNEISEPVKSRFGYHIIQVSERRKQDISLELARTNARNEVFRRKAGERFQTWLNRLRDSAVIEYVFEEQS